MDKLTPEQKRIVLHFIKGGVPAQWGSRGLWRLLTPASYPPWNDNGISNENIDGPKIFDINAKDIGLLLYDLMRQRKKERKKMRGLIARALKALLLANQENGDKPLLKELSDVLDNLSNPQGEMDWVEGD